MICVEEIQWVPATREEVIGDKELADRKFAEVVGEGGSRGEAPPGQAR